MTKTAYSAFLYSDRQLNDIEKFCCCYGISDLLAIDTTFNLCDLWLTDLSYRNWRLAVDATGKSPVYFGLCMFHFKKDEEAFRRFAVEVCVGNPKLIELKLVGVDMESAIYQEFKSTFKDLPRFICVRYLQKRDETKIERLLERTNQTAQNKKSKNKVILTMKMDRQNHLIQTIFKQSWLP